MDIEYIKPAEIEKRSMELIAREMTTEPPRNHAPVIRRVIHTTADFEYEHTLTFSETAVVSALSALRGGSGKNAERRAPELPEMRIRTTGKSLTEKISAEGLSSPTRIWHWPASTGGR